MFLDYQCRSQISEYLAVKCHVNIVNVDRPHFTLTTQICNENILTLCYIMPRIPVTPYLFLPLNIVAVSRQYKKYCMAKITSCVNKLDSS